MSAQLDYLRTSFLHCQCGSMSKLAFNPETRVIFCLKCEEEVSKEVKLQAGLLDLMLFISEVRNEGKDDFPCYPAITKIYYKDEYLDQEST